MISFESSGNFGRTESFLDKMLRLNVASRLQRFGAQGVAALRAATPVDSGETAAAWDYEVTTERGSYTITWTNSHSEGGKPVIIMLQYGHGTGTGGYVPGRDIINPALRPIFDQIADGVWKEVTSA